MQRSALHRLLRILPVLALLLSTGCGAGAEGGLADTDGAAPSAAPATITPGGDDAVELTVAGSPGAGTHRERGDFGCMVVNGLWQASWEEPERPGLSGLLLQVKGVPASGGSSSTLSFTATFGSQSDPDGIATMLDVHGTEVGRDGRATVSREGGGAVIRVEGTAPQGARVTAVLRCASVNVMS